MVIWEAQTTASLALKVGISWWKGSLDRFQFIQVIHIHWPGTMGNKWVNTQIAVSILGSWLPGTMPGLNHCTIFISGEISGGTQPHKDYPHWAAQPAPPPPSTDTEGSHLTTDITSHSTQTRPCTVQFPWQQICSGCRGRDDQIRGDSQLWLQPGVSPLTLSCPSRSGRVTIKRNWARVPTILACNKELDPPLLIF